MRDGLLIVRNRSHVYGDPCYLNAKLTLEHRAIVSRKRYLHDDRRMKLQITSA